MDPLPSEARGSWDAAGEYDRIADIVSRKDDKAADIDDAYIQLMSKERRVLDTVDRIVNDTVRVSKERGLADMPLHEVAVRIVSSIRSLLDDLLASKSIKDAVNAITNESRRTYLGICLIIAGFLLAFIQATHVD